MTDPYRSGGFAPVHEERALDRLAIDGAWPASLAGTLYRVGPNPQFPPIEPYNPLQGDGMVHAFPMGGGCVGYRNRWVRTRQWRLEHEAGRALFATSGDPRLHDPSVAGIRTDGVANTSLVHHAGRLLVLEEGHLPIEIDPVSLDTLGVRTFGGRLRATMTAHPKIDPRSGEMVFFANEPERRFTGRVCCYVADASGAITLERTLQTPFPSIVHDFAVTRDHLVLLICPVVISLARARAGGPALAWEPDRGTHIGVLRRDGMGEVRWQETEACFVWHVLNAWNDGDRITVDLCEQAAPAFPLPDGRMTPERDRCQYLTRWRVPIAESGDVERRRLSGTICEYPRIDDRFALGETRHGFFACHGGPGTGDPFHRGIGHYDQQSGRMETYRFARREAVSEPVFVPRSAASDEADGWLLCVVYDEPSDRSHVAAFDAQDVPAGPIARARLPCRVPMGFHGLWVPAGD